MLERIKEDELYSGLSDKDDYFKFLDVYNMKINSNQTKGIISGSFASNISSELLMLCIDNEISKKINQSSVSYIRYVDDLVYFSDSKEELESMLIFTQQQLNKYKLRINMTKTEITESIFYEDSIDFKRIDHDFDMIGKVWDEYNDLIELKSLIKQYLLTNRISEVKVILTRLKLVIEAIPLDDDVEFQTVKHFVNYLMQLSIYDSTLSVHSYKIIDEILSQLNIRKKHEKCETIIDSLISKNEIINSQFNHTLLQIWHIYLITKYSGDETYSFENFIDEINDSNDINPFIVSLFVRKVKNGNTEIFNYIFTSFKITIKNPDDWKNSIMLSKWWLPLLKLKYYDGHNYESFYASKRFNDTWERLI